LNTFNQRHQSFSEQAEWHQKKYNQLAIIRLFVFFVIAVASWYLYGIGVLWLVFELVIGSICFLILLKRHRQIARQRNLFRNLAAINQDEAARLELHFVRAETGQQFAINHHAYGGDLDIFGNHSLFRLLNRARTQAGMHRLAQWLLYPADDIEISVRQAAIAELKPLLDWRQNLEASALLEAAISQPTDFLKNWIKTPESPVIQRFKYFRWLPILTIVLLSLAIFGVLPWLYALLLLTVHGYVLGKIFPLIKTYSEQSEQIVNTLKGYETLIKQIESQDFNSDKLRQIKQQFRVEGQQASEAIGRLAQLNENLNFRLNIYFFVAVGLPTLWDLQWMVQIENWKKMYRLQLMNWIDALGEVEALASLAGFAYANPEAIFPDISPAPLHLAAQDLAHPLIKPAQRVSNSFVMSGLGQTMVITGSNMSGKSTFLRTVGLNVVLALAGSVVCAGAFVCARVRVYTSMRTQDSLEENTSSFYAELKRLKTLLELTARGGPPVLYFLDEILKGTNSADRHNGAKALILQLHQRAASGFVSTHDLELGELATKHDFVQNGSFNSTFQDGKLHFDYTLNAGICREFNAAELMRQIGIEIK